MSINSAPTAINTNITLSGVNVVTNVSGQTVVANVSGQVVVSETSGQAIRIMDATTNNLIGSVNPGDTVSNSVRSLGTLGYNLGFDTTLSQWVRLRATSSGQGISGVTNKLVVAFSGDTSYEYGTAVRAHPFTVVTNLSGGTEAGSGSCFGVTVRNHSGNGPMLLGGTGAEAPFSGKGMIVYGGESYDLKVDNFNKVRALAYTSGQLISVAGIDK